MNFTEVSNVCASCRVIEKHFLNLSPGDLNSMSMLTGNTFYTYTESRLFCESCACSTTYRVFHNPCDTTL